MKSMARVQRRGLGTQSLGLLRALPAAGRLQPQRLGHGLGPRLPRCREAGRNGDCPTRQPGVLEQDPGVDDHQGVALTQRDRDILDFERSWWTATSPKDVQIRERFELSTTRYHQILNEMLDTEEAMAYDPLVVRRLHRQRDRRRRARLEPRVIEEDGTR